MLGRELSQYRILDLLGAGGMGEVYRAEDTKLGREVALKVLPEAFTAHPEWLARFEREARALAAVDHPHIAALYSFESAKLEAGDSSTDDHKMIHFLVMQLAEGETLSELLSRGPVPVEQARLLALQISEALESAHARGIIHRDLKPGNIKVDIDYQVKILDFGLAKALDPTSTKSEVEASLEDSRGGASPSSVPEEIELFQTLTMPAEMTEKGAVLGTAGYMSPEQARGLPADRRSDIWAFGCVYFEMLTGQRVFGGGTSSERLARILEQDPDWSLLPAETPRSIRTLLRRCLAKNPKHRLHDMADVRLELEEAPLLDESDGATAVIAPVWRRVLPWVLAGVGLGLGVWTLTGTGEIEPPRQVSRFSISTPALSALGNPSSSLVAVSRDGSIIAYIVGEGHTGDLYLRHVDSAESVPLVLGAKAEQPFFSPDGAWVGFVEDRQIKRVSVKGGKIWSIIEAGWPTGATWGDDGTIVYADEMSFGLWRVPWDGGEPRRVTAVDRESGEYGHITPQFLSGKSEVLFTTYDDKAVARSVELVDLESGERERVLDEVGSNALYLESGHIAYGLDGSMMVVPFDLESREPTGGPVAVFDGLLMGSAVSPLLAHFAVAETGVLVYVSGPLVAAGSRLVRVGQAGDIAPIGQIEEIYRGPRFSPDGRRLAVVSQTEGETWQIWLRDLQRDTFSRLTHDGESAWPVWFPDGSRIVFPYRTDLSGPVNLAWLESDGTGSPRRLTTSELSEQPTTWTPDGKTLIFHRNDHPETGWDLMALDVGESDSPRVLLASRFNEALADLSPDGRWLAYVSDETGAFEVYVRSYPDLESKWQISEGGGVEPVWSPEGDELLYRDMEGTTVSTVPIVTDPELSPGRPEPLLEGSFVPSGLFGRNYDIAPDGQSLVLVESVVPDDIETELQIVLNWFVELETVSPTSSGSWRD